MSKPMERVSTLLMVRSGLVLSLAGVTLLAGCVAEVRPAYSPPPPPPAVCAAAARLSGRRIRGERTGA